MPLGIVARHTTFGGGPKAPRTSARAQELKRIFIASLYLIFEVVRTRTTSHYFYFYLKFKQNPFRPP